MSVATYENLSRKTNLKISINKIQQLHQIAVITRFIMDLKYLKEEIIKRLKYQEKFEIPFLDNQLEKFENRNKSEFEIYKKRKEITLSNLKYCKEIIILLDKIRPNSLTKTEIDNIVLKNEL